MFGALPDAAFESDGKGREAAEQLGNDIRAARWPTFPAVTLDEESVSRDPKEPHVWRTFLVTCS